MAKEYIEREAAIMTAMNYDGNGTAQDASQDIAAALGCIPAADVHPVVRGRWIDKNAGNATCSVCKRRHKDVYDDDNSDSFCRSCGADMRGTDNG